MYPLILLVIVVVASMLHIWLERPGSNSRRLVEIFLMYFLVIFVGVTGIMGFVGHTFFSDRIAGSLGWPTGSPFQFEVAVAHLSFGILGIMSVWFRENFWTATGVGSSIYFLGAAYGHAKSILVYKDLAPYNIGAVFYIGDILVPLIVIALVIAYNVMAE